MTWAVITTKTLLFPFVLTPHPLIRNYPVEKDTDPFFLKHSSIFMLLNIHVFVLQLLQVLTIGTTISDFGRSDRWLSALRLIGVSLLPPLTVCRRNGLSRLSDHDGPLHWDDAGTGSSGGHVVYVGTKTVWQERTNTERDLGINPTKGTLKVRKRESVCL